MLLRSCPYGQPHVFSRGKFLPGKLKHRGRFIVVKTELAFSACVVKALQGGIFFNILLVNFSSAIYMSFFHVARRSAPGGGFYWSAFSPIFMEDCGVLNFQFCSNLSSFSASWVRLLLQSALVVQTVKITLGGEEFLMGSAFDDVAVSEGAGQIGVFDG